MKKQIFFIILLLPFVLLSQNKEQARKNLKILTSTDFHSAEDIVAKEIPSC